MSRSYGYMGFSRFFSLSLVCTDNNGKNKFGYTQRTLQIGKFIETRGKIQLTLARLSGFFWVTIHNELVSSTAMFSHLRGTVPTSRTLCCRHQLFATTCSLKKKLPHLVAN